MNAIIIHSGNTFSPYITDCIEQFFLYNKKSMLYFILDTMSEKVNILKNIYPNLRIIYQKELKKSLSHRFYLTFNRSAHNNWRGGFWRYVVERFFLIQEFMHQSGEINLLHFEYDNLIYETINDFENRFINISNAEKILLTADGDKRCIAGLMFIPNSKSLAKFCNFYNRHYTIHIKNDMFAFSDFLDKCPRFCGTLPVVPKSYTKDKASMYSHKGIMHTKLNRLSDGADIFEAVFDAAAYGQFVGGIDQRNVEDSTKSTIGFINPDSAYNMQDFSIEWHTKNNLTKPFLCFKNEILPIFNLHIHSKNLNLYRSDLIKGTNNDK